MAQVRNQLIIQVKGVELADVVQASWQKGDLFLRLRSGKSVRLCDLRHLRTAEHDALLSFPDETRPLNLFTTAQDPLNPVNATGSARIASLPFAVLEEPESTGEARGSDSSDAACFVGVAALPGSSTAASTVGSVSAAVPVSTAAGPSGGESWLASHAFLAGIPFAIVAGGLLGKRNVSNPAPPTTEATPPSLTISTAKDRLKAGESTTVTFKFSKPPVGFTVSDVKALGGAVTDLAVSPTDPSVYTATFTPIAKVAGIRGVITVAAGAYSDASGIQGQASVAPRLTIDTLGPELTISSDKTAVRAGESVRVTFAFSEAPAGFAADDIVTTGGTLTGLAVSPSDPRIYTAAFTPTPNQTGASARISVAGNRYTDALGNLGNDGIGPVLTIDTEPPKLAVTSDKTAVRAGEAAVLTFTFSEPPTGFEVADIVANNGKVSDLKATSDPRVYTATFTVAEGLNEGSAGVTVGAGVYSDALGNPGLASEFAGIVIDSVSPALTITSDKSAVKAGETATITFTFSEPPLGFAVTDVVTTGGTLGVPVVSTSDARVYTATFTPEANQPSGKGSISVAASTYTDGAGNGGAAATSPSLSIDTLVPSLAISSNKSSVRAGETAQLTFTFSEPPTGFALSDIAATNGSVSDLQVSPSDPRIYTAVYTPDVNLASASGTIRVAAGLYADLAGNPGLAGTASAISIDTLAPSLTITSDKTSLKGGETAVVTFTFSEAPSGFAAADVVTTGGTLSVPVVSSTNPRVYTATFTPSPNLNAGSASVTVAAGTYTDAVLNGGTAASAAAITFDTLAPSLVITSDKTLVKTGETAVLTFTFSEAPSGFAATDVVVSDGTVSNLLVSPTDPKVYTATYVPRTGVVNGKANVSVASGTWNDVAGNGGLASNAVSLDVGAQSPTLQITSDKPALKAGETAVITFTFSEAPSGFVAGDIVTTGGTLKDLAVLPTDPKVYKATFTPLADLAGTSASITVGAGAYTSGLGISGLAGASPSISIDTLTPKVAIGSDKAALKAGETATLTLTFSELPNGFDLADLAVEGGTLSALSGSGLTRTVVFTPSTDSTANGVIRIASDTFTDAAGNANKDGQEPNNQLTLTVDTLRPTVAITSNVGQIKAGETATITFTFSEDPGATFEWDGKVGDISVSGGTLGTLSGTGLTRTAIFTPASNSTANGVIKVLNNAYTDTAGNGNQDEAQADNQVTLTVDTLAPTVALSASAAPIKAGETATITLTFSEEPVDFDLTDVGVVGGRLNSLSSSGLIRTAVFTPAPGYTGTATLSILDGKFRDAAGNANADGADANNALSLTVDTQAPSVSITSSKSSIDSAESATVTFTFSEPPVGFLVEDVTVTGGTVSGLQATADPKVYTATFQPTAGVGGVATISVANGVFTDALGNPNVDGGDSDNTVNLTVTSAPRLAATQIFDGVTNLDVRSEIVLTFSEDITLGSGTIRIVDDMGTSGAVFKNKDAGGGAESLQESTDNTVDITLTNGVVTVIKVGGYDITQNLGMKDAVSPALSKFLGSVKVVGNKLILNPGGNDNIEVPGADGSGTQPKNVDWDFDFDFGSKYHIELGAGVVKNTSGMGNEALNDPTRLVFTTVLPGGADGVVNSAVMGVGSQIIKHDPATGQYAMSASSNWHMATVGQTAGARTELNGFDVSANGSTSHALVILSSGGNTKLAKMPGNVLVKGFGVDDYVYNDNLGDLKMLTTEGLQAAFFIPGTEPQIITRNLSGDPASNPSGGQVDVDFDASGFPFTSVLGAFGDKSFEDASHFARNVVIFG